MPRNAPHHGRSHRPPHRDNAVPISKIVRGVAAAGLLAFAGFKVFGPEAGSRGGASGFQQDAPQRESGPPPGYTIKGNINVSTGARLYHLPGMRDYEATVVDTRRGERWFRTEAEAVASGWRKAGR